VLVWVQKDPTKITSAQAKLEYLKILILNVTIFDIVLCSRYVNQHFRGMSQFHLQGLKSAEQETSVQQVARLPGQFTDHMALYPYIPEDGNSHNYCRENLKYRRDWLSRMASSTMLRHVALVRTDVSEELSTSFIRVTRIGELGTTPVVTSNQCTLHRNTTWYCLSFIP
jgi:hypothetical protein